MMKHCWVHLVFILTVIFLFTGAPVLLASETGNHGRADAILIDTLAKFGKLERSPVQFLHDRHTQALQASKPLNLSCQTCHIEKQGVIYPSFKRFEDKDRITLMNLYHDGCISCHGRMGLEREKTGPVECDGCHKKQKSYETVRSPMGFDPSLHFRHTRALKNRCEVCHHEYNETEGRLVYTKGKEGTCRYCHKEKTIDSKVSMAKASHLACINCHIQKANTLSITGPISCSGCHDAKKLANIKEIDNLPRMDQKQPDAIIVHPGSGETEDKPLTTSVGFVPFNHKTHEDKNLSCRKCHHENWQPCKTCHISSNINGKSYRAAVLSLENIMHKTDSPRSCKGCHDQKKEEKSCAGCHDLLRKPEVFAHDSCKQCHILSNKKELKSLKRENRESAATQFWASHKNNSYKTDPIKIPESVVINKLADKYKAVNFPHGKIVTALKQGIQENKLSGYFHSENSICMGCHHNSPASETPPQCGKCHTRKWDAANPDRPGIMGAYHQQCIGCHKTMGLNQKADCTACHEMK